MGRWIRRSRSLATVDAGLVHYVSDRNELRSKPARVSQLGFWQCLCMTLFADLSYGIMGSFFPRTAAVSPRICGIAKSGGGERGWYENFNTEGHRNEVYLKG